MTVDPIPSERGLRNHAWIDDNRRTVDRLSGGKIGYAYLPNTGGDGYIYFNRYYLAQTQKEGWFSTSASTAAGRSRTT